MNDIDTLLRAADPAAETPDFTDAERQAILTAALTPQQAPRRRLGWRIGAVAAATLTAIGLGIGNLGGSSAEARADEVLTEAAINAVDPPSRPDQYWEVTDSGSESPGDGARHVTVEYFSVDGSRPGWYFEQDAVFDYAPSGEAETRDYGWKFADLPDQMPHNSIFPSPGLLASLPRDVGSLRTFLETEGKENYPISSSEQRIYGMASRFLTRGMAPADLRAALFETLKTVDGVVVVEEPVVSGRQTVVFALQGEESLSQLFVDPQNGLVVGQRYTYEANEGETVVRDGMISRRLVDEIPQEVREAAGSKECRIVDASGGATCTE